MQDGAGRQGILRPGGQGIFMKKEQMFERVLAIVLYMWYAIDNEHMFEHIDWT